MSDAVVVTGMGAASALGTGLEAHRSALWAGRHGIATVTRFDTRRIGIHLAATWPGWDGRTQPEASPERDLHATSAPFPLHELALTAAREAWRGSGVVVAARRAAVVFGTCYGQGYQEFSPVTERIAAGLDLRGPRITISTACASSTNAIGLGRDLLLRGHADVVIAGGADALLREALGGFAALGVLSSEPCAPFSDPPGTTLGEGAGFLVLERAADAARRGATPWASLCGYGLSGDAYHETTPDPTGAGLARAIHGALSDAGWLATDVEYVNAHATGTANNDRIEWSVIERELGGPGRAPMVSASKGHIGHAQGAAGALELVLALLCHREGRLPPTLHFRGARPGCPQDPVAAKKPRAMPVSRALKLSAAFGGANAVVAYDRTATPTRAHAKRAHVVATGAGVVGPSGALGRSQILAFANAPSTGACANIDLHRLGVDPRRLDSSSRWLTAATALALSEGPRESLDRTGLFVACTRMPTQSSKLCVESIQRRGIGGTSASAFARMSVNAPAGACARALGLLGPTSTLSSGHSSGLLALALAAEWLAWRQDAVGMIAGAVGELSPTASDQAEGAACLALCRSPVVAAGAVVVAEWAIAGPDGAEEAAERAMRSRPPVDGAFVDGDARVVPALRRWTASHARALGIVEASRLWGESEAVRSMVMAAVASAHIAAGDAESILVVAARGASSVAVVFERGSPR